MKRNSIKKSVKYLYLSDKKNHCLSIGRYLFEEYPGIVAFSVSFKGDNAPFSKKIAHNVLNSRIENLAKNFNDTISVLIANNEKEEWMSVDNYVALALVEKGSEKTFLKNFVTIKTEEKLKDFYVEVVNTDIEEKRPHWFNYEWLKNNFDLNYIHEE